MAEANKTEKATPRRRQKAREQGQVVRSRELVTSLATVTALLALAAQAPAFAGQWRGLLRQALDTAHSSDMRPDSPLFVHTGSAVFRATLLALGLSWGVAMVAAVSQGGVVFAPAALEPRGSRLSPAKKMEQLFSLSAVGRLLKSLLPGAAMVWLATAVLQRDWSVLLTLPHLAVDGLVRFTANRTFEIAWKSALVLVVWSGADYLLEKQKLDSQLRMSRQDLADEFKETEGQPAVKARIRRLQRQLRRRRMLEQVKRATVVITNPTEFAVALEYGPAMAAPVVLAKGRNLVARQIKELARWSNIPLVENPPLAHALYRAVEVGQSIPPKLYAVVAGILAAIYRAEQRAQSSPAASAGNGGR
jgi:flagellar biosynthetic protein FlhB